MLRRKLFVALAGCALLLAPFVSASAQEKRGPSTPEERKQALEFIQHFQPDPLNPNLKSEIQWVTIWAIEVPDVHMHLCLMVDLPKGNRKHGQTLFTGLMMAQTAFAIQHRDEQPDVNDEYQAGMEGLLQAYEKVLAANPKDRQPTLDDLLQKRTAGTLAQFVKDQAAAHCKG
jgi:hypothetical protein